jgi:hypothetical protein
MNRFFGAFSFLFKSIIVLAAILSTAYFIALKLFFTNEMMAETLKTFTNNVFERDSQAANINLAPILNLNIKKLEISEKGASNFIAQAEAKSLDASLKIHQLLFKKLWFGAIDIRGFNLKASYKGITRFEYGKSLERINGYVRKFIDADLLDILLIDDINISGGDITLTTKNRTVTLKNFSLEGSNFDGQKPFKSSVFFYAESKNIKSYVNITADLLYNRREQIIYISNLKCDGISVPGEGRIFIREDSPLECEFDIAQSRAQIRRLLITSMGERAFTEFGAFLDELTGFRVFYSQ